MSIWFFIAIIAISLASICISTVSLVRTWREKQPLPEVKLCPRCGTLPELRHVGEHKDLYVLSCMECGYTPAKNGEARSTLHGAVKVWNKGDGKDGRN